MFVFFKYSLLFAFVPKKDSHSTLHQSPDQLNMHCYTHLLLKFWSPIVEHFQWCAQNNMRLCSIKERRIQAHLRKEQAFMLRKETKPSQTRKQGKHSYSLDTVEVEWEKTERLIDILEMCPGNLANNTGWHYELVEWPFTRIKILRIAPIEYFSLYCLRQANVWGDRESTSFPLLLFWSF